jgi:Tfp pilus assembly protein PilF
MCKHPLIFIFVLFTLVLILSQSQADILANERNANPAVAAKAYFDKQDYRKAQEWYLKAVEFDPKDSRNYTGLGWAYIYQAKYKEAEESFLRGISVNIKDSYNYTGYGWVYLKKSR